MFEIDPKSLESVVRSPFTGGLFGALVLSFRGGPDTSWRERVVTTLSGGVMAGFISPAAAEYFELHTPAMQSGMAFFVGLFGLNMMTAILRWIKTANISDYLPWGKQKVVKDE